MLPRHISACALVQPPSLLSREPSHRAGGEAALSDDPRVRVHRPWSDSGCGFACAVGVGMGIKKNKHGQHVITKLLPGGAAEHSGHIFPGVLALSLTCSTSAHAQSPNQQENSHHGQATIEPWHLFSNAMHCWDVLPRGTELECEKRDPPSCDAFFPRRDLAAAATLALHRVPIASL